MDVESLRRRAAVHAALGEPHRLAVVDELRRSDRTPSELAELTGVGSNLLAFHLDALEDAGVVARHRSEGDARRRYVTLRWEALGELDAPPALEDGPWVFVCTRNAARSQLASALWRDRTGRPAVSAGAHPAAEVDHLARQVAQEHGLRLDERPRGYDEIDVDPALVVSVCDRAREEHPPWRAPQVHWSVPDPHGGDRTDFEEAFVELERRIDRLAPRRAPS